MNFCYAIWILIESILVFEEIEALLSLDVKWARVYGGGGYLIHREPIFDRSRAQWGLEFRGPSFPVPFLGPQGRHVLAVPLLGADFTVIEQLGEGAPEIRTVC